jgi:hypothetical protein
LEKVSDGSLQINLTQADVFDEDFYKTVSELSAKNPFTYIAVCLTNPNANLHIYNELKKCPLENKPPLAIRMTDTDEMKAFLSDTNSFSNVLLIGEHDEKVGIEQIIDKSKEFEIREFHKKYEDYSNKSFKELSDNEKPEYLDELWNKDEYYRRQANRSLYFHKPVKQHFLEKICTELLNDKELTKECLSENAAVYLDAHLTEGSALERFAKIEHRRWNYSFICEGWYNGDKKIPEIKQHDCLKKWSELREKNSNMLIYDLLTLPVLINKQNSRD